MVSEFVFDRVSEDQSVAVPILTLSYIGEIGGEQGRIAHTVCEVIYSTFDNLFAAHVFATSGILLPRARVDTHFIDANGNDRRQASARCPTLLDALIRIGEKAGPEPGKSFVVTPSDLARHLRDIAGLRPSLLGGPDLDAMRGAASLLADIADPGLCRVSATLDGATVAWPDSAAVFCEIDFALGLVIFPAIGTGGEAIRVPLLGFEAAERTSPALRARLRMMRDAMAEARRRAVDAFARACDHEIASLHAALAGRDPGPAGREVAADLTDRLVAAFGPALRGLSPHARLIALDWLARSGEQRRIERDLAA